uniref:Uncharacterized protein n=1 Tax=Oryza meridionalis TaxID=40149 RepID=A0A0E0D2R5_9ORYZ
MAGGRTWGRRVRSPQRRRFSSIFFTRPSPGTKATSVAQWLGQRRLESIGTAKWPTAALWTPRAASSLAQGELNHISMVGMRQSSPEKICDRSNIFDGKKEENVLGNTWEFLKFISMEHD